MIIKAIAFWAALLIAVILLLMRAGSLSRRETVDRHIASLVAPGEGGETSAARWLDALFSFAKAEWVRAALTVLAPALIVAVLSGTWWSICVTLPCGFLLTRLRGNIKEARRRALVRAQFYDFLDAMIQSLEGGFSIFQALEFSSEDVPPPLGTEVRKAVADMHYGSEFDEALERLRSSVAEPEFDTIIEMLMLIKQSGGNLPLLLRKLRSIMRDRADVARDMRVYTTQGRWTGYVVSSLPLAFLAIESVFSPSLIRPLFATPLGLALLTVGLALDAAGFLCVRRICRLGRA